MKVMVGQLRAKDFEREIRGIYFRLKNRAVGSVLVHQEEPKSLFTVSISITKLLLEFFTMTKQRK